MVFHTEGITSGGITRASNCGAVVFLDMGVLVMVMVFKPKKSSDFFLPKKLNHELKYS